MNVPEKHRAVAHAWVDGAEIEYRSPASDWQPLGGTLGPGWFEEYDYRVKPTKPSIDWSHVSKRIVAIATDANQDTWCYGNVPVMHKAGWYGYDICGADLFASFTPGTCDWRDSLIVRPGYED